MSLPEPFEWKNYNKRTGQGDPSTPFTAAKLNEWWQTFRAWVLGQADELAAVGDAKVIEVNNAGDVALAASYEAQSARDEATAHVDLLAAPAIGQVAGYIGGVGGDDVRNALGSVIAGASNGSDDTTALNALLSAHAGKTVRLRAGVTYRITGTLNVPSGTILDGNGATIDATGMPVATALGQRIAVRSTGTVGADVAVSTSIALGSRTVTGVASTTGITAGDLVVIRNTEPHAPGASMGYKGELNVVASVDSATALTLATGALFAYGTSGLVLQRVEPVRNVKVRDLTIVGGGVGSGHNGVLVEYGQDVTIERVNVVRAEDVAISFRTVWNGRVTGCALRESTSPTPLGNTGYGVAVSEGSRHVTVDHNEFDLCRHFVAGGGGIPAALVAVARNNGTRSSNYGYDCHEPSVHWTFEQNTATNVAGGFLIRGQNCTVRGNRVLNSTQNAVFVYAYAGVTEQTGTVVEGNTAVGCASGISVDGLASSGTADAVKRDVRIVGNDIRNTTGIAILLRHFERALVSGNTVQQAGGTSGIRCEGLSSAAKSTGLHMMGNRVDTVTGSFSVGIRITDVERVTIDSCSASVASSSGIAVVRCTDTTLTGSRVRAGNFSALSIDASQRVTVSGGTYSDSTSGTGDGVRVTNCTDVTVTGTTTANPRHGIYVTGTDYVIAVGNNARNNANATKVNVDATAVNKVVANNL